MSDPQDGFDRLSRALAGRYRVERELGRGGMAVVYLAEDLKHHRQVAIKILLPELAAAIGSERFLREIQIAAQLHHPHILALYDSGEADGLLYYVMPFVPGESLRQRLEREGQLPLEDALQITGEVASALGHAHMQGIVHRDVKPENILLSGGFALVADFGIARAITSAGGDQLTTTGITIGTPAYMSPEQAMAVPQIDGRSDQYSLACVLYEMLTGAPPFSGPSAQAVLARHTLDPVPPVRTLRATVPPAVEQAMIRGLAKLPADRYATTAAFQAALTAPSVARSTWRPSWQLAASLLGGVTLLAGAYFAWGRRSLRLPRTPSVAVLPFKNIGGDSAFSEGMAIDLIRMLGDVPGLIVAPRTTSLRMQNADDRESASLGIAYVVEGSVQSAGNQLRVTVAVRNTAEGQQIWENKYDSPIRDIFGIQDSISRDIATALQVRLSPVTVAQLGHRPTDNPRAYELYQRGRFFFEKRSEADLRKALEYFQDAIHLDSNYPLAYSGVADTYSVLAAFGYGAPRDYFPKAKVAALRAIALDSALAEAHTSLGFIALFYDWDQATAEREIDRAIALAPNYTQAHLYRTYILWTRGRMDAAIRELRSALAIEPFSRILNLRLVSALVFARRYEDALDQAHQALELDQTPVYVSGLSFEMIRSDVMLGRCAEALGLVGRASRQGIFWGMGGNANARCGRRELALAQLDRLRTQARAGSYVSHVDLGFIYAGLGDKDRAFAQFDSAVVAHEWGMGSFGIDPMLDDLRSDPRFARIVRRVGLTGEH